MTFLSKHHHFFFYLTLILLPTQISYHFWPNFSFVNGVRIDYLAPTIYATDLVILGIFIMWFLNKSVIKGESLITRDSIKKYFQNPFFSIISIILLFTVSLNVLLAEAPIVSLLKLITIIKLGLIILYIIKTKPSFKTAGYCLLFAAFYSCLIAWAQFINQSSLNGIFWFMGERTFTVGTPGIATAILEGKLFLRPYATFPHPNVLSGFLTALLSFLFLVPYKSRVFQLIQLPMILFFISTIFITFSRSGWIVTGIVLISLFIYQYINTSMSKKIRITWVGVGMLFIITLPMMLTRWEGLGSIDKQSITKRMDLNQTAVSMISDHPFFGVGLNNFLIVLPAYAPISSYQDLQPVHNVYLLFATEAGIFSSLLIGLVVIYKRTLLYFTIASFFKKTKNQKHVTVFLSLISIFLLGLFDHYPYTIHQMQLLFAVVAGFAISSILKRPTFK